MIYEPEYFYVYVRQNSWYDQICLFKVGVTTCPIERDSQYKVGEPFAGRYVLVIRLYGNKNIIDEYIKEKTVNLRRYTGGGTEFYCQSILEHIIPCIETLGVRFEVLTEEDVNCLARTKYERSSISTPKPRPLLSGVIVPVEVKTEPHVEVKIKKVSNQPPIQYIHSVLEFAHWNPKDYKFMAPKVNDKGGKSVSLISTQTSKGLRLNTPLLMTWGPGDFSNEDGTSDGKFKLHLSFPNEEYKTDSTDVFKQKMLELQTSIIDAAVSNSELWFGKAKSRETVEDNFFPFMKYRKVKDSNGKPTSKIDYSKPPFLSVKMPCYTQEDGTSKWDVDLYDVNQNTIFPNDDGTTPIDLIPKLSKIASTIQCTGIWVGGKGWGLSWKFISGLVKPKLSESIRGKCHI